MSSSAPGGARTAAAPATRVPAAETWVAAHRRWLLLALVVASIALRVVYFVEINAGPCIALERWDRTDMNYFDSWGRAIARGDWLSASVGVPMHPWHREVADQYFADHPDARPALERQAPRAGAATTAEALLWSRWTGGHQFYQDPLHAYLIGLTYAVFGPDPRFVLGWQMLLGVLTNVLIYTLARRYFGEMAGAVAATLAVLCSPLMYYELLLLRDSTIVFAGLGLVWLTDRALASGRWLWFALLGLSLGLAVALKSTFVLLALAVATAIVLVYHRRGRSLYVAACATTAGLAVALMPLAARNVALGVPPLALAGSGTLTFVASNDVDYPASGGFYVNAQQLAHVLGETDGRPLPAVLETLRPHSVASLARLLWNRFDNTWRWYEIPNNVNFYYMELHAPVLAWLPVTFYLLGPLGLVGLALAARRARDAWPLYVLVLCSVVSLVAFLVLGRLRVLLLAALIPFAALTIVCAIRGRPRVRAAIVAAALLAGFWTGRPLPDDQPVITLTDWLMPLLVKYQFDVKRALDAQDFGRAAAAYLQFLRYEPDFSEMPRIGSTLARANDRDVARTFQQIHSFCANVLRDSGQQQKARGQEEAAARLALIAGPPAQ